MEYLFTKFAKKILMKLPHIFYFLILGLIISCGDSKPKEVEEFNKKMDQTIAIHDEVMPEMTKINQLIGQLDAKMDSTTVEKYKPAITDLKTGHDKMMTWMKNFGDEFSKTEINQGIQLKDLDSLKSRLRTLDDSYKQAVDMRNHIQEAISNAELLLK